MILVQLSKFFTLLYLWCNQGHLHATYPYIHILAESLSSRTCLETISLEIFAAKSPEISLYCVW